MILLPDMMLRVLTAGGGLSINLEDHILLPDMIVRLATAAKQSGATLMYMRCPFFNDQDVFTMCAP